MNKKTEMLTDDRHTVLVIDDSAEDRATYCRYLQHWSSHHYQVREAHSALAGLDLYQRLRPDIILLDYFLPDMDGLEFLDMLWQQVGKLRVPVLMLTGQGNETIAAQSIKRGAQDYLIKGTLTADELCKAVAQALEQFQLQQRMAQQEQQQQILSAIALHIRQSLTLQTILDTSVTMVQQYLAADRVLVYQFTPDMSGQIVAEAVLPEWSASLNLQIEDTCFRENLGNDYRLGKTRAIANIDEAGLTDCHKQLLERFQVKASLVVPLLVTDPETATDCLHQAADSPRLWGLLIVHQCAATHQWQAFETELLNQVAIQVAIAIQQAELYDHLRQLNQTLEARVQARTAQHQTSEARLQRLAANIAGMIYQYILYADGSEAFTYISSKCRDLYELEPEALQQDFGLVWAMIHPEDVERVRQANLTSARQLKEFDVEFRLLPPSGRLKWLRAVSQPERQSNGDIIWDGLVIDITDHKIAALENLRLQERLQFLLTATPAVFYTCEATEPHGATFVSENLKLLTGYEPHEFVEEPGFWASHIHPDDAPAVFAELPSLFESGHHTHEYRFLHQDGTYRWMQDGLRLVRDAQGQPVEIAGYWIDISDRKIAELALQQSETRFRSVFEQAAVGLEYTDLEGRLLLVNQTFANMLGYSREELLALNFQDITHPDDLPQNQACFQQLLTGAVSSYSLEKRFIHKDRSLIWANVTVSLICGSSAQPELTLAIVEDIRERKQAEIALQKSEERFQEIANTVSQMFFVRSCNPDQYDYISPAYEKIWGRSRDELRQHPDIWLDSIHPDDRDRVQASITLQMHGNGVRREYRIIRPDGTIRWVSAEISVIQDESGHPLRFIGLAEDITDRKQAEEALAQALRRSKTIFDTSIDGIVLIDQAGNIIETNASFASMLGYSVEEATALNLVDFNASLTQVELKQKVEDNNLCSDRFETRHRRKDGSIYDVEISSNRIEWDGQSVHLCICRNISDRKRTEAAVRESERRLATLISNLPGYVYRVANDPDYTPEFVSEGVFGISGYRQEDYLIERTISCGQEIHPDDAESVWNLVQQALAAKQPYECEYRIITKTGDQKWVWERGRGVYSDQDELLHLEGFVTDISDRKHLEQELVKSRDFRERIFNESSDALFLVNAQTMLTLDCNQRAVELFEVASKADLINIEGQTLQKRQFTPEERTSIRQEINQKGFWSLELEYISRQGREFWGELSAKRIAFGDQWIDLVRVTDISDRKHAELALQQLNQELEHRVQRRTQQLSQSEERLRLALIAANQGLYDLNVQTGEAIVSPEYATMLGYDPTTFQETNAKWIARLHPDDIELVSATYRAYVAGEISNYQVEFRQRTQKGHWKWILSIGKMVSWDEAGHPLRMLGTHTDIDDRKQIELALRESKRFLQTVIDTFPLVIFWKDRNSVYLGCNQKFAETAGLTSPANIIGKTDYDMPWSITEADAYRADDREVLESGIAKLGIVETQTLADGSMIWIETNKLPLYNLTGELIGLLGTYQDITDRKRAETALQQLNLELEQRVRARTFELSRQWKQQRLPIGQKVFFWQT